MKGKNIEKLYGLGQQICDVVERVFKLELNDSSQWNDAYKENLNKNAGETLVSSRLHGFHRSRHYWSTPFGQGVVPRTQEGIIESIGPAVPDYCAAGEDIQSEYTCIKNSVVKVKLPADLKLPYTTRGVKRAN